MDPTIIMMDDERIRMSLAVIAALYGFHALNSSDCCFYINSIIFLFTIFCIFNDHQRRYFRMLVRDIRCILKLSKIFKFLKAAKTNNYNTVRAFKDICNANPNKVMFYFEEEEWTFKDVDNFSNKVANYFSKQGLKKDDAVALFMETRIEYVPIWLGLHKIGVSVPLINSNLTEAPLAHSISAVPVKAIIYGPEVAQALDNISKDVTDTPVYIFSKEDVNNDIKINKRAINLNKELENSSTSSLPDPGLKYSDKALYIFTSGTTGVPKAALLTHGRYVSMVFASHVYTGLADDDIIYDTLPLYHTNGGVLAAGEAVTRGLTVALRKKFSASSFWKDCTRYNCTVFFYIGELCRYLLAQPRKPDDREHKIRLIIGNGLRPNIWENFVKRFNIGKVGEMYGSSEGVGVLMNCTGKIGAVGYLAWLWPGLLGICLVEVDPETEMPVRNSKGHCIKVETPGVPGMLICKLRKDRIGGNFEGYADKQANSKKILRNVFKPGDEFFLSGDIFIRDNENFFYFQDRTGDTYRWRGENVSTTEVEQVVGNIMQLKDVAAYGVEVPGNEGKAGMIAIVDKNLSSKLESLQEGLTKKLPKYARPLFIRQTSEIRFTETFKIQKKTLKEQGYNPDLVNGDLIFYYSSNDDKYLPLTTEVYNKIKSLKVIF